MLWPACKTRSVPTTTGFGGLQNAKARRCGVGRVCAGLLGEGGCSTGTKVRVTEKGGHTDMWGAGLGTSKLGRRCQYCIGSCRYLHKEAGEENGICQLLCYWRGLLVIPVSLGDAL